ncbi:MAG: cyclodeaminase/cyclohydrolase family protein [Ardenticatenaceae bacterium]|nr:cyclodeaminase/cyclohydrolase family protein [Ardenticatenaceae bacterium]
MSNLELIEQPLAEVLQQLSNATPTPGGGAAAAAAGAMAAALLQMVAASTLKRRRYQAAWPAAKAAQTRLPDIQQQLSLAVSEDAVVYRQVVVLLAHQNEANSTTAIQAIEDALTAAAQVPLKVAKLSAELIEIGVALTQTGNAHAAADGAAACHLALAALKSSTTNVKVNLRNVTNEKLKKSWINQVDRLALDAEEAASNLDQVVHQRLENQANSPRRVRRKK